jgi:hypothetical protein
MERRRICCSQPEEVQWKYCMELDGGVEADDENWEQALQAITASFSEVKNSH